MHGVLLLLMVPLLLFRAGLPRDIDHRRQWEYHTGTTRPLVNWALFMLCAARRMRPLRQKFLLPVLGLGTAEPVFEG